MELKKGRQVVRVVYEWVQTVVYAVLVMVVLFTFFLRVVRVDGESMRETLQDQDMLIVLNGYLCGKYEPEDIVVLSKSSFRNGAPIVKRVIAVEGQMVDIDFDAGIVYVDGEALNEAYVREPTWTWEGLEFPITVPEGHVFVLGDNRNDSSDSRHSDLGTIDTRMVIGKALLLAVPGTTENLGKREWNRVGLI